MRSSTQLLQQPPELLTALLDVTPIGIYALEDDRFAYVNRTFAEALGYSPEEILALGSAAELIVEEHHERVREVIRRRAAGDNAPTRYALRLRCRDGRTIETEIHSSVAHVAGQRVIVGAAVDVTARCSTARQIAEREEYFRALTENVSDIIAILDAEGITKYVSP